MRTYPPLYTTYAQMKQRCYNSNHDMFNYYGGRGISICDERLQGYSHFYKSIIKTIGSKPSKDHTLDRIDNNGNYEPCNIRRADWAEQFCNRSDNVVCEGKTLSQRARHFNIGRSSFHRKYKQLGFEGAKVYYENKKPKSTYLGLTRVDIASHFNITPEAIMYHEKRGLSLEQIYNKYNNKL